jgi:transposase
VENEGITIKEAASNLKINYSTAKHIVKVYKRTGQVTTLASNKRKGTSTL